MKKLIVAALGVILFSSAIAQPSLVVGNEKDFKFKKQPGFTALPAENGAYFIFNPIDIASYPTLVTVSNNGDMEYLGDIRFNSGNMSNMNVLHSYYVIGNELIAFVENRDKSTGINKLSIRKLSGNGSFTETTEVGSFPFEKMGKPGDWYTAMTPDKKHIAVVGVLPSEKDNLLQFKYYFLDENLKATSSGQFNFPDLKKRTLFNSFHAANDGRMYLVVNDFDKTYRYPLVHEAKTGATTGTIKPIMLEDPKQKMLDFTSAVNANGDLIIAGYTRDKSWATIGEEQATGTFMYSSGNGKITTFPFKTTVSSAKAQSILFNGNTIYLAGEQLLETREKPANPQSVSLEENYNYKHNDVLITAFSNDGNKLFDLTLQKDYTARNFDQDLYPAVGIVNNKLAVVYNDQYGKYVPNTSYDKYKVPVVVYITNDGLMESPKPLHKEFKSLNNNGYILYPKFSVTNNSGIVLLAGNGTSIKPVVIK